MDYSPVLYRGIDFVLKTRKPAKVLITEWAQHIHFNRAWQGLRIIVLSSPASKHGIEAQIKWFCDLVENLSPQGICCWKACSARLIDIGVDSGNVRHGDKLTPIEIQIAPALLKRISDIRGKLVFTVYPLVDGAG